MVGLAHWAAVGAAASSGNPSSGDRRRSTLDPGEVYELVPEEYVANTYDRLVRVDLKDPSKFNGDVAQSWSASPHH